MRLILTKKDCPKETLCFTSPKDSKLMCTIEKLNQNFNQKLNPSLRAIMLIQPMLNYLWLLQCIADESHWLPRDGTPVHWRLTNPTPSISWNPLQYQMVIVVKWMWYCFHHTHLFLGLGLTKRDNFVSNITTPNLILLQHLAIMFFGQTI